MPPSWSFFQWNVPLRPETSFAESFLESFSLLALFVTVLVYWFVAAFYSKGERIGSLMVKVSHLSLALLLLVRWITSHHFPLSNLYESLLFLSWSFTGIHILLEKLSKTLLIGLLFSPITLFVNSFALFTLPPQMQKGHLLTPALQSNWLMMHVTVMISSYAALLSGSLLGIAFLLISHEIYIVVFYESGRKRTTPYFWYMLPFVSFLKGHVFVLKNDNHLLLPFFFSDSKESIPPFFVVEKTTNLAKIVDNLSYRTLGIGFPLLTIGILSGAVWANEAWGSYWSWDPKETWALITWIVFAVYLHTRINKRLDGKKPAIIAAVGFLVIWVCFIGVNLANQGLHTYGWFQ